MRQEELDRVGSALASPMTEFVSGSGARTVILLNHSGQVLAQHGVAGDIDVTNVAALAAAAHASAHAVAGIVGEGHWVHLHHAGEQSQLFLAPVSAAGRELILVAIFPHDTGMGVVHLWFDRLVRAVSHIRELADSPLQD